MEPIDAPKPLHYNNGKLFPSNRMLIGYVCLGISVVIGFINLFIAVPVLLLGLFICFTRYGVIINPETNSYQEYTVYLGLIKIGKALKYKPTEFLTVIPARQSSTTYSRTNSSYVDTEYYFSICLLNERYRNKRELIKYDQKSMATDTAKQLSHQMGIEYFEYDPYVIREKFLQMR